MLLYSAQSFFADILSARINQLYDAFNTAISDYKYKGIYRGVYPIKVNQQKQVVAEIMEFGRPYHHGLEAGSKAELMAALAYTEDPESLIVCNGYKDEEFIDLALYAQKMGLQSILVIDSYGELELILERAQRMGIRPNLGVRVKLSSRGGGHWDGSGGDRSMFGLNTAQLIELIDNLRTRNMLDCLKMLHSHLGSQISNIRNIRAALREAGRVYAEMAREGAAMGIIDIGGGLAVDYDGSHTNFASSRNYTEQEYAADAVEAIMSACDEAKLKHPRSSVNPAGLVAHHSVLVFNVLNVSKLSRRRYPTIYRKHMKLLVIHGSAQCHSTKTYRNVITTQFITAMIRSLFQMATCPCASGRWRKIFSGNCLPNCRENTERKYVPEEWGWKRRLPMRIIATSVFFNQCQTLG